MVIVIAAIGALWVGMGVISRMIDGVVEFLGRAIGSAFRPRIPQPQTRPQGEVTLTMPGEKVHAWLASAGALDPGNSCLTTSSGLLVQIVVTSSSARLECRWDPTVVDKPTQIMGDVLRAVRRVDPGAQVLL
ncbi:MAG TPA: hypothetical protein VG816_09185 [Solirubrobacterales bacterium]|nr:hypothetical protein [Solirubrobacterales bacterium]